jgi:dTDP-4-dehydrorhamnose reductase
MATQEKTVLVLGAHGMLGSMVLRHLQRNPALRVRGTTRNELPATDHSLIRFDAERFLVAPEEGRDLCAEWIVNCIGVIKPFCKDNDPVGVERAIAVNGLFPHRLAKLAAQRGSKIIQIATDCVFSGTRGQYVETDPHDALDVYGKTKSLGEVFDKTLLNVRCSIIGPEVQPGPRSLLEWFLHQPERAQLKGFAHHRWNGVTTLQFAQLCEHIILGDRVYESLLACSPVHHFTPNNTVDKYELLSLFAETYGRSMVIERVDSVGPPVDRTLATRFGILKEVFPATDLGSALAELRRHTATL